MFSEGMYIKTNLQNQDGDILAVTAQIDSIKKEELIVLGFENIKGQGVVTRRFRVPISEAKRTKLKNGAKVNVNGVLGEIIAQSRKVTKDKHYTYWCKVKNTISLVSEARIQALFGDFEENIVSLFCDNSRESIDEYLARYEIDNYVNKTDSITDGYQDALGKKIDLYEHQIDSVQKVLSNRPYRAILADEVGLGKTIEALVILNYMLKKAVCKSVILVVPDQLLYQWYTEAKDKFDMDITTFSYSSYMKRNRSASVLLVGFDNFVRYADDFFVDKEWGFMIVDEVHKSLNNKRLYSRLLKLSKHVNNKLLLSATPIMKRNAEYFNLLKLLYPENYTQMKLEEFSEIMSKREVLEDIVAGLVSDIRYAFDDGVLPEYIDRIRTISEEINDYKLKKLISDVDVKTDDEKKTIISQSILYLQRAYELESKFIRHRRADILDESAKRILSKECGYYLKGEDQLSKELELYHSLTDEIVKLGNDKTVNSDCIINLANAFFSSASALYREITGNDLDQKMPNTHKLAYFESNQEKKLLSNSRIEEMVKYLKALDANSKVVIFSDYYETVQLINKRLVKEYGSSKVVLFTGADSEARMQIAANAFKQSAAARFLICDKFGAEGRNFQFADIILHFDLPWSPARLEQRIGRLDRIGRKSGKKVNNVVFYVKDSVEEDLFSLYNNCLDIFNESLCGIEIIFDELWDAIRNTVAERGLFGFSYVFDLISELKSKCTQVLFEEMLDLECMQEESENANSAKHMLELFSDEEKQKFYDAVIKWHYLSGYGTTDSIFKDGVYYVSNELRDHDMAKKHSYSSSLSSDKKLTYDLEKYNYILDSELLTSEHDFVKGVMRSVDSVSLGKTSAISISNCEYDWKGFVITWKVEFYGLDNMGANWSQVNYGIKNDYVNRTRISIPYAVSGDVLFAEDIISIIKANYVRSRSLSIDEISELLDYADVKVSVNNAINETRTEFIETVKNGIDYSSLKKKITILREDAVVNKMIGRDLSSSVKMLQIYESIWKMLNNFGASVESIIFVNLSKE